jgi:hypothetical protein
VKLTKNLYYTNPNNERFDQAVVFKDGASPILSVPHVDLPVGVETTFTKTVTLTAGTHYMYFGTAVRLMYGQYGYVYSLSDMKLVYMGY